MTKDKIIKIYMDMVPQYLEYNKNLNLDTISIDGENITGLIQPTEELSILNNYVEESLPKYIGFYEDSITTDIIELDYVIRWLEIKGYNLNFRQIIDFLRKLENKTNENSTIAYNFVINSDSEDGEVNFFEIKEDKILDSIAENLFSYIELDKNLNFVSYGSSSWSDVKDGSLYDFLPNFLRPLKIETSRKIGISRTKRGDIIIYGKYGILATKRKGNWKIYEVSQIKNSFVQLISNTGTDGAGYWIAYNLFQLALDLSYKRQGALIIFSKKDENHLRKIISNVESILLEATAEGIYKLLLKNLGEIDLSKKNLITGDFVMLSEIATIDGAITISSEGKVYSFSSIIKTHEDAKKIGARNTASYSALHFNPSMAALKISSDGEIELISSLAGETISLKFL